VPQVWSGWQAAVLADIPAPDTADNVRFLTDWHSFELSGAQYNPLNTTQKESGSTTFNSAGVQNYTGPTQGAKATAQTLDNGFYGNIVAALKEGSPYTYAMSPAIGRELTTWGTPNFAAKFLGTAAPSQPGGILNTAPPEPGQSSIAGFHQVGLVLAHGLPKHLYTSMRLGQHTKRNLSRFTKVR
jgi:hypothetical protein